MKRNVNARQDDSESGKNLLTLTQFSFFVLKHLIMDYRYRAKMLSKRNKFALYDYYVNEI